MALTNQQRGILRLLADRGESNTREIADALHLGWPRGDGHGSYDAANASLARLEKRGLVERHVARGNGVRVSAWVITDEGKETLG